MLNVLLRRLFLALLALRYRLRIVGLEELGPQDGRGILFLPNHPALIDPFILLCVLYERFPVRPLAGRAQIEGPVLRWLARRTRVLRIPDAYERGAEAKHRIATTLRETVRAVNAGDALLFYPAGRLYQQRFETLGRNSGAAYLIRSCPNARIVLVRTTGLWGSSFSRANERTPTVERAVKRGLVGLLKSGLLFAPRRSLTIEFTECSDVPPGTEPEGVNRYLESYYNAVALPNTYVPYSVWERGRRRVFPEPERSNGKGFP